MAYSVSELVQNLNTAIRLSNTLTRIEIEGEIIGYHGPNRNGHIYFDLKDDRSIIKCMMFSSRCTREYMDIIREGAHVSLYGSLNYHQQFGLSFVFERISDGGEGARMRALLELRRELEELGMFDEMYKKPIPRFPRTIGLITSSSGAAIGDVVTNAKRNDPFVRIIVAPALMEGEGAAQEVASAIRRLDEYGPDVILLTRGGGSKDSLWTFNERVVAQAVFDCSTPIVSAIGHDRDTSIADDIADHHESTPTGAAMVLTAGTGSLISYLESAPSEMLTLMNRHIRESRNLLKNYSSAVKYGSPESRLERRKKELEKYRISLVNSMKLTLRSAEGKLDRYRVKLPQMMDSSLKKAVRRRDIIAGKLEGLSPVGRLKSGFSYVTDDKGRNIRSIEGLKPGDVLSINVLDGEITSSVTGTGKTEKITDRI
ncbi:MAG: exodeoxyribonuclease VII large subunit [Lachnospiraceae bacterium]|nr:exodeoxyribonuclease VII large subunit [Lachnospiraceae bacterium]